MKHFSVNLKPLNYNNCEGKVMDLLRILDAASYTLSLDKSESKWLFS